MGPNGNHAASVPFTAGSSGTWTQHTVEILAPVWATNIRCEVYLSTNNYNVVIDNVILQAVF